MKSELETRLRTDLRTLGEAIVPTATPNPFAPSSRRSAWRPIAIGGAVLTVAIAGGTAAAVSLLPGVVEDMFEIFAGSEFCGEVDVDRASQVATGARSNGRLVELWVAPTSPGHSVAHLRTTLPDGQWTNGTAICDPLNLEQWAFSDGNHTVGETTFEIVIAGYTSQPATSIRLDYASGAAAFADVNANGYFITTIDGTTGDTDDDPTFTVLSP